MLGAFRRSSTTMLIFGVLAVIFGLVASFWPLGTAVAFATLWGIYAIADGVTSLGLAFSDAGRAARGWLIAAGVMGIFAGVLVIARPFSGATALAWILGIWLLVRGLLVVLSAFMGPQDQRRWLLVLSGILWLIAGVLVIANPGSAVLTISLWIGILAIVWGLLLIGAAIAVRARVRDVEDATSSR